jgi:aldehyde dehydrogenase (NAD+)
LDGIACVYTSDLTRAFRISAALQSGGVSVNSPLLPELNTPFGGIKQSGQGRELGVNGLYSYLEPKSVHIK